MRYAPLLALAVALSACNRPVQPNPVSPEASPGNPAEHAPRTDEGAAQGETATDGVVASPKPLETEPAPSQKESEVRAPMRVADASNALGFDLYAKIRGGNDNLAFSPASVMAALAMTYGGADGVTREEMAKVLYLDPNVDGASAVGKAFAELSRKDPDGLTLRMANRLFGDAKQKFEASYLKATADAFGAPLEPMNFRGAPEPSRLSINQWVAKQTEQKIRDLIPSGGIDTETRLVLVNAVYFLGNWQVQFEKERTYPEDFHLLDGGAKKVPMMHASGHRLYGEADGVKLLELSYRDGDFAMLFVLPKANDGLADVEAKLSPAVLAQWVGSLSGAQTEVTLPKFKIEPAHAVALGRPLRDLGMTTAFDRKEADFSRMAKPVGEDRLSIGEVFHKAFVAVDEAGTEAAAATAVVMRTTSAAMREPEIPKVFRADHPFLFFLRHKPTGLVLFMGRVTNPEA